MNFIKIGQCLGHFLCSQSLEVFELKNDHRFESKTYKNHNLHYFFMKFSKYIYFCVQISKILLKIFFSYTGDLETFEKVSNMVTTKVDIIWRTQ